MTAPYRLTAGLLVTALCLGLAATPPARADTPGQTDAEFSYKQVAMIDDGYRAVAILARGKDDLKEPAKARDFLVESHVAREKWGLDAKTPLSKGKLAYMVCQALGIKGGLVMRLFGPSERYCLFECEFLELMTGGATYENVTGGELVSTIDRADQYKQAAEAEAARKAAAAAAAGQGQAGEKTAAEKGNKDVAATVKKVEIPGKGSTRIDSAESSEKATGKTAPVQEVRKIADAPGDAAKPKPE
ncbi:MAG: hypothetical protein GWP05_05405 [Anaerolineaceae bacterium]|nr:hypothetical protein [Anaerolineaceae bacterium]